jgi:hypothetical protein
MKRRRKEKRKEKLNINIERDAEIQDIRKNIKTGSRKTKKIKHDNEER